MLYRMSNDDEDDDDDDDMMLMLINITHAVRKYMWAGIAQSV